MRIGRNKPEVIDELSKQLGAAEGNRDVTLKFKVTKLETQDTNQGKRSRIFSRTERVRLDGINLNIFIFVYISDEVRKQLGKLKAGDEIIATGTVSKTEFDVKDIYRLTIDLKDSKVTVVN